MRTIPKYVRDMNAGDVINPGEGYNRLLFISASPSDEDGVLRVETYNLDKSKYQTHRWGAAEIKTIEAPERLVTREQLDLLLWSAGCLFELANERMGITTIDQYKELEKVLDELRPPEPPTLEEALEVLLNARDRMREHGMGIVDVNKIIERARRAGKIK